MRENVYHPALSPEQFGTLYHGSQHTFEVGDLVSPPGRGSIPAHPAPNLKAVNRQQSHVYATNSRSVADYFASDKHDNYTDPGVYQVEPTGAVTLDPYDGGSAVMSRHPMRVVAKRGKNGMMIS